MPSAPRHAEDAAEETHAESAENAELKPHAESAEFAESIPPCVILMQNAAPGADDCTNFTHGATGCGPWCEAVRRPPARTSAWRIHAAPESCVHVVPLRALDAPGSETEGEHAEGAEPKSHAETAETAESAEFAESIPPQWEKEVPFSTK